VHKIHKIQVIQLGVAVSEFSYGKINCCTL